MRLVKYIVKTSLSQKKIDWNAYRELCCDVKKAKHDVNNEQAELMYKSSPETNDSRPGCMYVEFNCNLAVMSCGITNMCSLQECENFNDEMCTKKDCPYLDDNRRYHYVCAEYERLRDKKKHFWQNTIAERTK